ncbi:hypothetical protein Tco_0387204 [Tanacetum coccineum]
MSVYIKHMGGYKHNQLKGRSYDEIQKLFDKEMKRVNSFVALNLEAQEISGKKDESSSKKTKIAQDSSAKRAGDKLEYDESKKQKTYENEEVEEDNDAKLEMHMVIVKYDDIAVDAIPLTTKPPVIGIDKEDLETLWKLVKTKHGDTRPEDEHEKVLWGDLKIMFKPDIKSDLGIESYQIKINLTAPMLIFPVIEESDPYSIVDESRLGLIYLNIKEEKRVMNLVKNVKFCDATLEIVLKEVKLKIFETKFLKKALLMGDLDLKIMKMCEREIMKRLRHHEQMRRWESFMNERPILPTMRRQ